MYFVNDSIGFAGGNINFTGVIVKTSDGGDSWQLTDLSYDVDDVLDIKCIDQDTCYTIVSMESYPYYALYKTTNGGGIGEPINIESETLLNELNLFPNPATSQIQLSITSSNQIQSITTFNYLGEVINLNFNETLQADVFNLPTGIYFTEVITENGSVVRQWVKM